MKFRKNKFISLAMAALLLIPGTTFASVKNDYSNHYASSEIQSLINMGIIKGYEDGSIRPNSSITRAEFVAIVNRAFGFKSGSNISFTDVKSSDWYYSEIRAAINEGYIAGYPDGTMRPKANVTRQEASAMLARILDIENESSTSYLDNYSDGKAVPAWAKQAVASMVENGYLNIVNNNINSTKNLTRGDMAYSVDRAYGSSTNSSPSTNSKNIKAGEAIKDKTFEKDVKITGKGVTLKNVTINGNLTIDKAVGNGDVYLDSVTVKGDTIIYGGGENTIEATKSKLNRVIINKDDHKVRLYLKNGSTVQNVELKTGGIIETDRSSGVNVGTVKVLEAVAKNTVKLTGKINDIQVYSVGTTINLDNATVKTMDINKNAGDCIVSVSRGTVLDKFTADAKVDISGSGKIKKAVVTVSGSKVDVDVETLEASSGVTVNADKLNVRSVEIKDKTKNKIESLNGTLQLAVEVLPTEVKNKDVTWEVDKSSLADVSSSGLVKAKSNGTVRVTVTSKQNSNKSDYLDITITGQGANKTALDSKLKEVASYKSSDYTSGFEVFQFVRDSATAINNKSNATQSEVDNILNDLNNSIKNLVAVDKTEMQKVADLKLDISKMTDLTTVQSLQTRINGLKNQADKDIVQALLDANVNRIQESQNKDKVISDLAKLTELVENTDENLFKKKDEFNELLEALTVTLRKIEDLDFRAYKENEKLLQESLGKSKLVSYEAAQFVTSTNLIIQEGNSEYINENKEQLKTSTDNWKLEVETYVVAGAKRLELIQSLTELQNYFKTI